MANTIKPNAMLLAATLLVMIFVASVSEAAPFFMDRLPSLPTMNDLPRIELPEMRYLISHLWILIFLFLDKNKKQYIIIIYWLGCINTNFRLPEIDPQTMMERGGRTIARTTDGVVVMLDNGMQAFMRTTTGVTDGIMDAGQMFLRMLRSLPFIG